MARCVCFVLWLLLWAGCSSSGGFERSVRQAVSEQLRVYPESSLRDIYKNFFQDRFGPGHLVDDTAAAGRYLRMELASMGRCDGRLFERTGERGNFYRVNLSLIRDGVVGYDRFFDLFVRSVRGIVPPPVEVWRAEWLAIERVVMGMDLGLRDVDRERVEICARLDSGRYVGHHSEVFERNYRPHYRIISRELVERELWPLLPDSLRGR